MYNGNVGGDIMLIDIIDLKTNHLKEIVLDEDIKFDEEKIKNSELLDLKEVHIKGIIFKDSLDDYQISADVTGIMVLPCSITLKPVTHKFSTKLEGSIIEMLEEIDENIKNVENSIDILPIIWENILVEIPSKVVSEEANNINLKGDGWQLVTDDTRESKINPELEKLKDLL